MANSPHPHRPRIGTHARPRPAPWTDAELRGAVALVPRGKTRLRWRDFRLLATNLGPRSGMSLVENLVKAGYLECVAENRVGRRLMREYSLTAKGRRARLLMSNRKEGKAQ